MTAPGDVVGTLEYVAPEQIKGESVGSGADVYSLACVLYECLTCSPPFPRATDVALLWAHVHEEPTRASALRPELPSTIDPVLARAVAKDPARRYSTAGELVAAARTALGVVERAPPSATVLRMAAATVAVALVVVAIAAVLVTRGSGGLSEVAPNAVGVIDTDSNKLVAQVPVGATPESVAVAGDAAWVANFEDRTISVIDLGSRRVIRTVSVEGYPSDVAVEKGTVWTALTDARGDLRGGTLPPVAWGEGAPAATNAEGLIAKLTWFATVGESSGPQKSATLESLFCRRSVANLAVGRRAVWFGCDTYLGRVDPTARVPAGFDAVPELVTPPSSVTPDFSDVALGLGSLWLTNAAESTVAEIDPTTGENLRKITVGRSAGAVAVGFDSLWVASFDEDVVTRVAIPGRGEPVTFTVIDVGNGPVAVVAGQDAVWVANELGRTVSRLDPATSEVVATIELGSAPRRLAVADEEVWVTTRGTGKP